jgi:hypothetical protein
MLHGSGRRGVVFHCLEREVCSGVEKRVGTGITATPE